jgi:hypothetical protein
MKSKLGASEQSGLDLGSGKRLVRWGQRLGMYVHCTEH